MQITAVDQDRNLFHVTGGFPQDLVQKVLETDWANLPWRPQGGHRKRRLVENLSLEWNQEWHQYCEELWPKIGTAVNRSVSQYTGTAWWIDEPGFTCNIHTDGEMPGAIQMTWIGENLGTTFYHYKDPKQIRHQFTAESNAGYLMINNPDSTGYRRLQWHGMLTPVPANSIRVSSYSWLTTT
jgi:hypothetical protein